MAIQNLIDDAMKEALRVSYALRRVPEAKLASLLPLMEVPQIGDVAVARLETIGKNAALELANGRRCALHEGDLLAVAFGNRYATKQFEGYARTDGDRCDLLSMGGLCGLVENKHQTVADPSRLRLLGTIGDADGQPLRLRDFAVPAVPSLRKPRVIVVCGSSMDAGKTYTAMSLISGMCRQGYRVAGAKLTGTAAGRDTWNMLDAGACVALDFIDGGFPSTYLCTLEELLDVHNRLVWHAAAHGAQWLVVEIADGLLQRETALLLQAPRFRATVDAWLLAAGEALAAAGGVATLRNWGITPIALSGLLSLSSLDMREAEAATGIKCLTARELQVEGLKTQLIAASSRPFLGRNRRKRSANSSGGHEGPDIPLDS